MKFNEKLKIESINYDSVPIIAIATLIVASYLSALICMTISDIHNIPILICMTITIHSIGYIIYSNKIIFIPLCGLYISIYQIILYIGFRIYAIIFKNRIKEYIRFSKIYYYLGGRYFNFDPSENKMNYLYTIDSIRSYHPSMPRCRSVYDEISKSIIIYKEAKKTKTKELFENLINSFSSACTGTLCHGENYLFDISIKDMIIEYNNLMVKIESEYKEKSEKERINTVNKYAEIAVPKIQEITNKLKEINMEVVK